MINPAQLGKVYIQNFAPNNPKKLCSMVVNNNIFGNLTLETRKYEEDTFKFITELKNTKGKLLGKEIFSLDPNNKKLQGFFIEIAPEYRKKHFKFGELLRLSSIIEMLENRMSKFEIYSKDTAIYFHSKYKFIPNIQTFVDRDKALESIISNQQPGFEEYAKKAAQILEKIKTCTTSEMQRQLRSETNTLTLEYIQKVLENKNTYPSHPFKYGMDMLLTKEKILENKNFFNELFKTHGIDYQI